MISLQKGPEQFSERPTIVPFIDHVMLKSGYLSGGLFFGDICIPAGISTGRRGIASQLETFGAYVPVCTKHQRNVDVFCFVSYSRAESSRVAGRKVEERAKLSVMFGNEILNFIIGIEYLCVGFVEPSQQSEMTAARSLLPVTVGPVPYAFDEFRKTAV